MAEFWTNLPTWGKVLIIVLIYLAVINVIGFFTVMADKIAAKKDKWRVPEKNLFLICIIGGCPLTYGAMKLFHHKTQHKKFMIGIPVIFFIQIAIIIFIFIAVKTDLIKNLIAG